jgi:hypothetical protein
MPCQLDLDIVRLGLAHNTRLQCHSSRQSVGRKLHLAPQELVYELGCLPGDVRKNSARGASIAISVSICSPVELQAMVVSHEMSVSPGRASSSRERAI